MKISGQTLLIGLLAYLILKPKDAEGIGALMLKPVGRDSFNRQVYKSEKGNYYKDVDDVASYDAPPKFKKITSLTTSDGFEGEPEVGLREDLAAEVLEENIIRLKLPHE